MTPFIYKRIILVLAVALLATSVIAVISYNSIWDRPGLSDEERHEYQMQICDLEMQLGYPACFIDGEFVQIGELNGTRRDIP